MLMLLLLIVRMTRTIETGEDMLLTMMERMYMITMHPDNMMLVLSLIMQRMIRSMEDEESH